MECDQAARQLGALADRELGPLARWRLLRHVGRCAGCASRLAGLQALHGVLGERLQRHRAPPALAARIGAALAREPAPPAAAPRRLRRPAFLLTGTGVSGALAGAAVAGLLLTATPRLGDEAARAVVDSHIRSLLPGHLTEVLTSDRHTVKPWLSARAPVSPPVRDLADEGFPLVGGRLDYVDGHEAACVVYRHDKHVINLIVWASPGESDQPVRTLARQGFNLITWRRDGATFWVASDLEAGDLRHFAEQIRG